MWDRVGFSNPTFLKSLDYLSLPHHEHSPMRHSKLFCFLLLSYLLFQSEQLFSWLIGIAFFSMTVINQPKKPHTIVHCTVGKVGSKREAENKTAPLSIFCHLLPWDIIMHRQWRRKTIICQVLCSTIHTVPNNSYSFWADLVHKWLFLGYGWHPWILIQNSMPTYYINHFFIG